MKISLQLDKEMVAMIANGDEKAFARFFESQKSAVYSLAIYFTKNSFLAEEITQEVFVSIWVSRSRLQMASDPNGYFYTIIVNKSIEFLKKQKKRFKWDNVLQLYSTPAEGSDADRKMMIDEYEAMIQKWIALMPSKRRNVYMLRRSEGLSVKEIAVLLNISNDTVKNHLKAAGHFLREKLSRHQLVVLLLIIKNIS